jgi:hypothetical protein
MRFPGHRQLRPQRVADERIHRFMSERRARFLSQPLPHRFPTATALRLGEALLEGLPHGLGYQRRFARRPGHRQQLGDASARIGGQPTSHGIAIAPQQPRHMTAGAGLLGLEEVEGLQAPL